MLNWPCVNNPNRPIPNPFPYPSPCPPKTLSGYAYLTSVKSVFGLPANVPQQNPGSPNPQPGQLGYVGFPRVPSSSFVP
jgi:hypothetical protein